MKLRFQVTFTAISFFMTLFCFFGCIKDKEKEASEKDIIRIRHLLPFSLQEKKDPESSKQLLLKHSFFYKTTYDFMSYAADDLKVDFDMIVISTSGNELRKEIDNQITNKHIDAFIIMNNIPLCMDIFDYCEKRGIPFFIFNSNIMRDRLGSPRERYKHWIGEIVPDDFMGGYDLAKILIQESRRVFNRNRVSISALAGTAVDGASVQRVEGLKKAVKEDNNAVLNQVFLTYYLPQEAEKKFFYIKRSRYPETDAIWTVGDTLALAALKKAEKMGLSPGRDILIGGFDLHSDALDMISKGKMTASLGGHLLDAAFSIVLVSDYLRGIDFADDKTEFRTRLIPALRGNSLEMKRLLFPENIKTIDFREFSRYNNSNIDRYDFSYHNIVKKLSDKK